MRKIVSLGLMLTALSACSMGPRPLVPDSAEGPASYVCYSSLTAEAADVRAIAERQCRSWGMSVKSLIGQSFAPLRCGLLTPTAAAFRCASGWAGY